MSRARRTRGFTLIELLVAITLAGLVAVLGAVVLRAALDFHSRAVRYLKESEDLHAADRLLSREWSGRQAQELVATMNRLEFGTDRVQGVEGHSLARVRYLCSENEAGEVAFERRLLVRVETDQPGSGGARSAKEGSDAAVAVWQVLRAEVLVPRLVACSFGYLQTRESRDTKVAEWRLEVGAGQPVPRLVRLRLVTERGEIAPLVYEAYGTGT